MRKRKSFANDRAGTATHSRGNAVRLEVEADCPKDFLELLLEFFNLSEADAYKLDGPLTMDASCSLLPTTRLPS